ncbi:AAA family ATPase [Oceanospirillum sanctuarii]|uniref:AAA family ATPase n=1 Tax=Oceanospirillum sanctuarii TaxID=1434821 RepID=UPI000A38BE28|nr:AAA family ATPase [Oceanospirillum sanctuarii]
MKGIQLVSTLHQGQSFTVSRGIRHQDQQPVIVKRIASGLSDSERQEAEQLLIHEQDILRDLALEGITRPLGFYRDEQHSAGTGSTSGSQSNSSSSPDTFGLFADHGGLSLRALQQNRKLEWHQWLPIAIQITEALGRLHQQQIIHKQISPDNILLNPMLNRIELIDFTRASRLQREQISWQHSRIKPAMLPYIAPEQTGRINRSIDYRTDFYSLGVTLYELFTGRQPFQGKLSAQDPLELIHRHIAKQPPSPLEINPRLPEALSQIVLKLVAKDADQRYQSSHGISFDLKTCLQQWQEKQQVENFMLASHDLPERFVLPQKLYGRHEFIRQLNERYDETASGQGGIVLISGYAGVGKSSLVHEIRQTVNEQKGHFISGKFGQFGHNRPYAAIVQALQSFIRQLLTEPKSRVNHSRSLIIEALGHSAQVLIHLIPELELIIGPQPEAPRLAPAEEKNRFSRMFMRLLRAFASEESPLVMFLDDLHWADPSSIELLEALTKAQYGSETGKDSGLNHLLLIGSYRDEELAANQPLQLLLDKLRLANKSRSGLSDKQRSGLSGPSHVKRHLTELHLEPLNLAQIKAFLSDTLSYPVERCHELATICLLKTQGNPFFLSQFLTTLQDEGLIHSDQNGWHWDKAALKAQEMSDDVVGLMVNKIQQLDPATQKILRLASCIGNPFSLRTLAIVNRATPGDTATDLWPALAERLIIPLNDNYRISSDINAEGIQYRFVHDRVQQAAYSLIQDQERGKLHLEVGELLQQGLSEQEQYRRLFEITNHLNMAHEHLSPERQLELVEMNLRAGEQSRSAAAFGSAAEYFRQGLSLLDQLAAGHTQTADKSQSLRLTLSNYAAEAAYILSDFITMQQHIREVLESDVPLLDKVRAYELQIQAHISLNQFDQALDTAYEVLALLGVELPRNPDRKKLWLADLQSQLQLRKQPLTSIPELAELEDANIQAALPIMASMFGAIKFSSSGLRPIVMARQVQLTLSYGLSNASAQALAGYGGVLCGQYNRIQQGYELGKVALEIDKKRSSRLTHHKTLSLFDTYVRHWKEPLSNTLPSLELGYQSGLECGDVEWSTYCIASFIQYQLPLAENLDEIHPKLDRYLQQIIANGQKQSEYYSRYALQTLDNLRGASRNPTELNGRYNQETAMLELHTRNHHRTAVCLHHFYKALLCYLFGQLEEAEYHCKACEEDIASISATYTSSWLYFIAALTHLALVPSSGVLVQQRRFSRVLGYLKKVSFWAKHCPENHKHRQLLIKAELARVQKRYKRAMDLYEQAIVAAESAGVPLDKALSYELAARLYKSWQKPVIAETYLHHALKLYQRLGAQAKADHLSRQHQLASPERLSEVPVQPVKPVTGDRQNQILDISSVIQASHAIADEIELTSLLGRLISLAMENAGGQRAILALRHEDELFIEAEADLHETPRFFSGLRLEEEQSKLPVNIVHYVYRTKETVVLSNALEHEMFMYDPYLRENQPRSLLCMPILYHGNLTAILYLENRESTDVFTKENLETLRILAAQSAISIENAKLYQSLKESEQEFRSLFENAVEGIFRTTARGEFLSVNPAFCALLGFSCPADFLAERSNVRDDCFQETDQLKHFTALLQRDNRIHSMEAVWLKRDLTEVDVAISARRVTNEDGEILYYEGSVTDISERKHREQAEQARLEATLARQKAEAASEAKSQFMATMSHEIRTPMNGILGMAQLLMRGELTADQQAQLQTIYTSGQSLLAILNDVLDFTKAEAGQLALDPHPFRLQQALNEVSAVIRPMADEKGLNFDLQPDPASQRLMASGQGLMGDKRALCQILLNLCTNAIKFTERGGVTLRVLAPDALSSLRFEIQDTGIGIAPDFHGRIFQHFSQADNSVTRRYGGTGLGLSICKQLTELQGGSIGFESEPLKGSTFWVELSYPRVESEVSALSAKRSTQQNRPPKLAPLSILLVEDTEINQRVAAGLLQSDGHRVDVAYDGFTALSLHHDHDYDLVLMDIHLPDMDGVETSRRMRQHPNPAKAAVPIVALTAALTSSEQQRYQQGDIDGVLAKPLQYDQLVRLLESRFGLEGGAADPVDQAMPHQPVSDQPAADQAESDLLAPEVIEQHISMLGSNQFRELVAGFHEQYARLFAELTASLNAGDNATAAGLCHRLAGSCANFGLKRLQVEFKVLEQRIQEESSDWRPEIDLLRELYQRSSEQLQACTKNTY